MILESAHYITLELQAQDHYPQQTPKMDAATTTTATLISSTKTPRTTIKLHSCSKVPNPHQILGKSMYNYMWRGFKSFIYIVFVVALVADSI